MTNKKDVDAFLALKEIAVVGVSAKKMKFGSIIYKDLKKKNYTVYPVNPKLEYLDEDKCYSSITDLPESVTGAVMVLNPRNTEKVLETIDDTSIKHVWIQNGAESNRAIELCKEKGITVIAKECILMFAQPVNSFHSFHRWLWGVFGKLPE